jgi:hypothetical protein
MLKANQNWPRGVLAFKVRRTTFLYDTPLYDTPPSAPPFSFCPSAARCDVAKKDCDGRVLLGFSPLFRRYFLTPAGAPRSRLSLYKIDTFPFARSRPAFSDTHNEADNKFAIARTLRSDFSSKPFSLKAVCNRGRSEVNKFPLLLIRLLTSITVYGIVYYDRMGVSPRWTRQFFLQAAPPARLDASKF